MRSMTGFGRAVAATERWQFTVSVRSVNHRFLDVSLRCRDAFRPLEGRLRRAAEGQLHRGRVEVSVESERLDVAARSMTLNDSALLGLDRLLATFRERGGPGVTVTLGDLLRVPGLVEQGDGQADVVDEADEAALLQAFQQAVESLIAMREVEGENLRDALLRAVDQLEEALADIEARREEWVRELADRLTRRLERLLADRGVAVEPSRFVQEAAVLTERSDITEELERWAGHVSAVRQNLTAPGPHGKKLDFLAQEILREVNTVGSKARDLTIAERVVDAKLASEALREQIQNVE